MRFTMQSAAVSLFAAAALLSGSSVFAQSKDSLPIKPFHVSVGVFTVSRSNVDLNLNGTTNLTDTSIGVDLRYTFRSLGSRRQNEDSVGLLSLFGGGTGYRGAVRYEHTWGFGSGYYAIGLGGSFGSGNVSGFSGASRLGVYLDRKQTFAIESMNTSFNSDVASGLNFSLRF